MSRAIKNLTLVVTGDMFTWYEGLAGKRLAFFPLLPLQRHGSGSTESWYERPGA